LIAGPPRVAKLSAEDRGGLIPVIRDPIDILRRGGFRAANEVYESMLQWAGEIP